MGADLNHGEKDAYTFTYDVIILYLKNGKPHI